MNLTTKDSREIRIGIAVTVLGAFVVSVAGGALGVYVGYRMLEQRMSSLERVVEQQGLAIENNRLSSDARLSAIAVDVSYIRGKLENK